MDEKIYFSKGKNILNDEHKNFNEEVTKTNLNFSFHNKKINALSETLKSLEKKINLIRIYIFILFAFLYICLHGFYTRKFKLSNKGIFDRINKYQLIPNKTDNKIIAVKNAEDEPMTFAKIIIENDIDYTPKISVIIPVYNTEEYLDKCVQSVINQTLKEIEIICIDDGSTDNSFEILKKYAKIDKRITIIKQENLNAGVARNAGLTIAKGKYLSFLDSDDFFELNMLEVMYEKILYKNSDIIICRCKSIDLDSGKYNTQLFNQSLRLDLIPKNNNFSVQEIPKIIFQFCEGWTWDKLFKADFILSNNIKFQNIINFNDNQFTFTALCLAKSITTTEELFVIKRHGHKNALSSNRKKDPFCFLLSFDKIKNNLEKNHLYNLVKESFWNWVIKLCIIQLKHLDKVSKENLFKILHRKFKEWDYIDFSPPSSNRYRALHYIKYQNDFPTINVVFMINNTNLYICLTSLVSLLINSSFENLNIILLYHDINLFELQKIYELKEIRPFNLQTFNVSYYQIKANLSLENPEFNIILLINIIYQFTDIDKVLYLSCNTIVRKSLLPLWEINMEHKLVAGVEDILLSKDKAKKINLQNNFYINDGLILLNIGEMRKLKLDNKTLANIKTDNKDCESNQDFINILPDSKKVRLSPEFNYMEILDNNICQYDEEYFKLYKTIDPTVVNFQAISLNMSHSNDSFHKEFFNYNNILININNMHLIIPIVLSSDNNYSPFLYTTMISILENAYKSTYYILYLLVPSDFSKRNEKLILGINDKYKCNIHFIYIKNTFNGMIMKIPHITLPTFYRLLVGNILPQEVDKCIYLDVDMCVRKDLSELFNIQLKNNYIAGVVAAGYYFSQKYHLNRLNISSVKKYVNAGMLLINIKEIRKDKITEKFIELSKKNYESQDQDVLNVVCYGKILTLPPKYNAMVLRLQENNPLLRDLYSEEDIIEANSNPIIVHYPTKNKPWNSIGIYLEKYWWEVAKKTPYINSLFTRERLYKNYLKAFYYKELKKQLNFERPKFFNEKIQWLKVYDSTPLKTRLSDKYLVRDWVQEKIGEEYLIPLLGSYDKFDDIDFESLPEQFVIKCNHGSNYNIIVKNKTEFNSTKARLKVESWLKTNFAYHYGLELQYRDIKPKIIIEKYIDDGTGDLRDYKFTCFNGKPDFIWVDSDRHSIHKRNLYDLHWNQLPYMVNPNFSTFPSPEKPKCLKQMVKIASILSTDFNYVRVDLYLINDSIYFGEMTFTSSSGTEDYRPKNFERRLSLLLRIPKIAYNIDTGEFYQFKRLSSLYPFYIFFFSLFIKILYNFKKIFEIISFTKLFF